MGKERVMPKDAAAYFILFRERKRWRTSNTGWQTPMPRNNFFGTNAWILYGHDQDRYVTRRKAWSANRSQSIRLRMWAIGRRVR